MTSFLPATQYSQYASWTLFSFCPGWRPGSRRSRPPCTPATQTALSADRVRARCRPRERAARPGAASGNWACWLRPLIGRSSRIRLQEGRSSRIRLQEGRSSRIRLLAGRYSQIRLLAGRSSRVVMRPIPGVAAVSCTVAPLAEIINYL